MVSHRAFLLFIVLFVCGGCPSLMAQTTGQVQGQVTDAEGPLQGVTVRWVETNRGTTTDSAGYYRLQLPAGQMATLEFRFLGYQTERYTVVLQEGEERTLNLELAEDTRLLEGVEVSGQRDNDRERVSLYRLDPKTAQDLPSAFGEFNQVLATLPGVVGANELSSAYSVRGGNFDENLVYVNDMPVYRPFLVRAGQQEGLSFINPDLVGNIEFSAGGWEPEYGDKMASVLNIQYRKPTERHSSASVSLLGATAHVEGTLGQRLTYLAGIRHKRSQYLLNTLPTQGQYRPKFTDMQMLWTWDLSAVPGTDQPRTELEWLASYAQNEYLVFPESQVTDFGTFSRSFRLQVLFIGQEQFNYRSVQNGLKLTHRWTDRFTSRFMASSMVTGEREFFDVEGGYRICDVDNDPGSSTFNECLVTTGFGSLYRHGRNQLSAQLYQAENRNELQLDGANKVEFGASYAWQGIDDVLDEYNFRDSLDYVEVTEVLQSDTTLRMQRLRGYVQHRWSPSSAHSLLYGVRLNWFSLNRQLLVSPRMQYAYQPVGKPWVFRAAAGAYHQPPFYRELRGFDGAINPALRAQRSYHFIAGTDYEFQMWDRPFKLTVEGYHKLLRDLVPYDLDNVRIRYYADNLADGYASGLDVQLNGEFIEGAESWFSLGLLRTREDWSNDTLGYIRRPTDQLLNAAIYFQDHVPWDETLRVNLNAQFGTGLPFSPPQSAFLRNVFVGDWYRRVDVGFSKMFTATEQKPLPLKLSSIFIGVQVLNLLGASNDLSYLWIRDFQGREYAVPNAQTQRFFNVRLVLRR